MKPCQMAGPQCPHEAVVTVRIDRVGDRPLCGAHATWVVSQGFGRVLDPNAFVPEWRKHLTAQDRTGLVVA